jgi:hypothetical protein
MPTVERPNGIRVSFPDTMALTDAPPPRGRTRTFRDFAPPSEPSPLSEELIDSLSAMDLQLLDTVPLHTLAEPSDSTVRRSPTAEQIPSTQEIELEADVGAGERAVALIEQDGLYSWSFGEVAARATDGAVRRSPRDSTPGITVRFSIPIYASSDEARRTRLLGMERIFRPIKAFVFKLPAQIAVGQVVKHLERDIDNAVIRFTGPRVSDWKPISNISEVELPNDRAPRVLLMIHGTFSSTVGAFGALGATDFGRAFMTQVLESYDAVLGFDHRTLSVDPLENAIDILSELRKLESKHPIVFDAVAHSRGGLVVRSLIEHLLPGSGWNASVRKAVFVAATNGGTELANSENWHRLIDLYTNLAVGSIKSLSLTAPQATPVSTLVAGLIKGLAVFVKALATTTLDEQQALGLAAMSPNGPFVSEINKTQPGQPTPDSIDYYAITSDFEPSLADEGTLPAKLLRALADGAIDQLMGETNDLVVNVASMTSVDPHTGGFVTDILDYGSTGLVHHSNYFHHEGTNKALTRWLKLNDPTATVLGGVPDRRGGLIGSDLPPFVEDDFLLVPATASGNLLLELLEANAPEFVVIRRQDWPAGPVYHYAYRPEELTVRGLGADPVQMTLDLHESQSSGVRSAIEIDGYETGSVAPAQPQTARSVVISDGHPVGVLPHEREMRTAAAPPDLEMSPPPPARAPAGFQPGRRRGGGALRGEATGAEQPIEAPERIRHYFRAQMPREVKVDDVTAIEVTMSLEDLAIAIDRASGVGNTEVDTERSIIFDVRPRIGFEAVADSRLDVEPLKPGDPSQTFYFDVRATDEGPGEIDVVVRQGQVPLVSLKLEPLVVTSFSGPVRRLVTVDARVSDAPQLDGDINELTIWEQFNHGEAKLKFLFRAPALNIRESAESKPIPGGVQSYVAEVYQSIEDRWMSRSHTPETFTKDLQAIGMRMFQELVPEGIQRLLWTHRSELTGIQVLSDEPYVPWEIVHLKGSGDTTREEWFLGQMGLVRWLENLENNGFGPKHLDIKKTLAVIPDYPKDTDWELAETAFEFDYLRAKLGASKVPSNRTDVDAILENPGSFDLLHFAGHGEAPTEGSLDASLILGVEASGGRWLTEELDSETVAQFANLASNGTRPMVVLNACQVGRLQRRLGGTGGFAKAFLSRGAGVFVSSLWAVGDEPARHFVEALYESLHSGERLSEAVSEARRRSRDGGDFTWLAYTVYANPHATVSFG